MEPLEVLARSRALWNRAGLDLNSDETLAQILDRGSIEDWRALYSLMANGGEEAACLSARVHALLSRVPIAHPYFWLAVLAGVGQNVDWSLPREAAGEADL